MLLYDRKRTLNQIMGSAEHKAEGGEISSLHACVEELISAISEKNVDGAVSALKAAFADMEAEPHHEGPHTEEY